MYRIMLGIVQSTISPAIKKCMTYRDFIQGLAARYPVHGVERLSQENPEKRYTDNHNTRERSAIPAEKPTIISPIDN